MWLSERRYKPAGVSPHLWGQVKFLTGGIVREPCIVNQFQYGRTGVIPVPTVKVNLLRKLTWKKVVLCFLKYNSGEVHFACTVRMIKDKKHE